MSFSTVLSAAIEGLSAEFVHVEADVSNGLPVFHMVGYLSSEVKERENGCGLLFEMPGLTILRKGL